MTGGASKASLPAASCACADGEPSRLPYDPTRSAFGRPPSPYEGGISLAPHLVRQFHDHAQLRPLLLVGEDVAFLGRSEAALRRQRELLERRKFCRLVDPALDGVLVLERARLGGDEAEHDDLVALRQEAQRVEAAGAVGVVFQEIAIVV